MLIFRSTLLQQYEIHFVIIQLDQLHFPLLFIFARSIQVGLIEIYCKFKSAYVERWNSITSVIVLLYLKKII